MGQITTREILVNLGFKEDWKAMTDQQPAYLYDFGNMQLSVTQILSKYFRPVFFLSGVAVTHRTIREINFEMPLEVESFEQGVALIVHAIGRDFKPDVCPEWFMNGIDWKGHLPWGRD